MKKISEDMISLIIKQVEKMGYIKPQDIPNIELYMDQVTTFMDGHLQSSKRYEDDKMLTKTMINNYTKNNLLPPPNKKKYSKEHMLLLIFIYYFKNILSINDIQKLFDPLTERFYGQSGDIDLEGIYNEVFSLEKEQIEILTKDVLKKYAISKETFSDVKEEEERDFLNVFSFICMLSFDVYVKKMMIEKLLDGNIFNTKESKDTNKKDTSKKETTNREKQS